MKVKGNTWKSAMAKLLVALMVMMSVVIITPNAADAASKPAISKSSSNILMGKSYDLNVKNAVKGSKYVWSTSNKKVATVNKDGVVKGVNKGAATITCKISTPKKNTYTLKCAVTIVKPATSFKIKNKVTALNVGQKYDLDRVLGPSSSNDKTTWTTSDKSIAAPDKNGKFVAKKTGTVTITGKTLSGAKDSVKIKVVDKDGTVATQKDLDALVGSGAAKITIKTDKEVKLTIKKGNYSKQSLVVDAPKADVENNGVFASINILNIKSNTWFENAVGNLLKIAAKDARIVVGKDAKVSITVTTEGAKLTIENNGIVEEIIVDKKAELNISGTSKEAIKIVANIPGIKITTSVPLNLECNAKIDLVLLKGAEASKITAASKDVMPTMSGDFTLEVKVGKDDTVGGTPAAGGNNGGGNNGGNTDTTRKYVLDKPLTDITEIYVTYAGKTYTISNNTLAVLVSFLESESTSLKLWEDTVDTTKTYDGQKVNVKGAAGSLTKTVSFIDGDLAGKSYTVTVNANGMVSLTSKTSGLAFTIVKGSDMKSLVINNAPASLNFTIKVGDTYILEKPYTELKSIKVVYAGEDYSIDSEMLTMLKGFLNEESLYLNVWKNTTGYEDIINGQTVKVTGEKGSTTKTVTFVGGELDGKSYTATVNEADHSVSVKGAVSYTISKGTDNKSLTITDTPAGLVFTPVF